MNSAPLTVKKEIVLEIICFLYVLLFVYAGLIKLLDYQSFANQIGASPLLRSIGFQKEWGGFVAWVIPAIEFTISLMLTARLQLAGMYLAVGVMFMFTLYIVYVLLWAPYTPCSCGGVIENLGWIEHLLLNSFYVLIGAIGIVIRLQVNSDKSMNKVPGYKSSGMNA